MFLPAYNRPQRGNAAVEPPAVFNFINALGRPSFSLPLNDLGAGAVNLVPSSSAGSPAPTFTRATVAWTKLASGLWAQVAIGQARSSYLGQNTVVGAYGGYLSEAAGIQLVTPTASIRDMTDASWVAINVTPSKTATGIDGAANSASTITATLGGGTILQTLVAAATSRNFSAFVRRKTGVGTLVMQQGATTLDVTAQLNSVTYTRVLLNANVLNAAFGFIIGTNGDAFDVDFNQFEDSAPIGVTAASSPSLGVRNADVLTYPFPGNVNPNTGAAYAEVFFLSPTLAATRNILDFDNLSLPTTNNSGATSTGMRIRDGVNNTNVSGLQDASTAVRKRASSWGGIVAAITGDGVAPVTGVFSGTMNNSNTAIGVGSNAIGGFQLNGMVSNIRLFPVTPTLAQLRAMTQ